MSADFMPASSMSDEELLKYVQMKLDKKVLVPETWIDELTKRLAAALDAAQLNEF